MPSRWRPDGVGSSSRKNHDRHRLKARYPCRSSIATWFSAMNGASSPHSSAVVICDAICAGWLPNQVRPANATAARGRAIAKTFHMKAFHMKTFHIGRSLDPHFATWPSYCNKVRFESSRFFVAVNSEQEFIANCLKAEEVTRRTYCLRGHRETPGNVCKRLSIRANVKSGELMEVDLVCCYCDCADVDGRAIHERRERHESS